MLGNLNQRQHAWADHDGAWFSAVVPAHSGPVPTAADWARDITHTCSVM